MLWYLLLQMRYGIDVLMHEHVNKVHVIGSMHSYTLSWHSETKLAMARLKRRLRASIVFLTTSGLTLGGLLYWLDPSPLPPRVAKGDSRFLVIGFPNWMVSPWSKWIKSGIMTLMAARSSSWTPLTADWILSKVIAVVRRASQKAQKVFSWVKRWNKRINSGGCCCCCCCCLRTRFDDDEDDDAVDVDLFGGMTKRAKDTTS